MISLVLAGLGSRQYLSVPGILKAIEVRWPALSEAQLARGARRIRGILRAHEDTGVKPRGPFRRRRASWSLTAAEAKRRKGRGKPKRRRSGANVKPGIPRPPMAVVPAPLPPPPPPVVPVAPPVADLGVPKTGVWQFFDAKKGGWCNYDADASTTVEAHYQDYLKTPGHWDIRSVESGKFFYLVDFPRMKQKNIVHEAHTERDIRRLV